MRIALLTSFLVLACAVGSHADEVDASAQVHAMLAKLDERGGALELVTRELVRLGPDALPALLDAWRQRGGRRDVSAGSPKAVRALERALESQRADVLERHLREEVQRDGGVTARIEALHTIAAFGRRSALSLAIEIVGGFPKTAAGSPAVVAAWERALETLLEDRAPVTRLLAGWRHVPVALHVPTARVLAAGDTKTDVAGTLAILKRADEHIPELVGVLEEASPVILSELPIMAALLDFRSHRQRNVRAAAARLMGGLGRDTAFTALVGMLDDDDGTVRRAAAVSLRELTGASAGSTSAAWKRWHDAEKDWLKGSGVTGLLRSDRPGERARALREMGKHPFISAKHVALVQRIVDGGSSGERLLALATLQRMNRAKVAPDLVRHLNDKDGSFRTAVWKTLRALTGEDLPAKYRDWKDATRRWRS